MTEYAEKKSEFCKSCAHETAAKARSNQLRRLEEQLSDVRDATCPKCFRSLPLDGDCYGCQVDRMKEALLEIYGAAHVSIVQSIESDDQIIMGHMRDIESQARAALAGRKE